MSDFSPQQLFEADFFFQLKDNPEYASQAGQHDFDHRLQELSPESFELRQEHNESVLKTARALLLTADNSKDALHLELLIKNIEDEQRGFALNCHLYPVNSIGYGGVHNNFMEALDWLGDENKGRNFLSRMAAFPHQCQQYKELLRLGSQRGCVASACMVRLVPGQLQELLDALDSNTGPVCAMIESPALTDQQRSEAGPIKERFRGAVADLLRFFQDYYLSRARPGSGCGGVLAGTDTGVELYAQCLKFHTTTSLTAAEIHAIGLQEVSRIARRYQVDVLDALGFQSSFAAFVQQCQDPGSGQYYQRSGDMMEGYRILNDKIASLLPTYFERLPASPLQMEELHSPSAPAAFYMQGTVDLTRPGKFYVNVSNLEKRPIYNMTALALHEGMPGHHLQGSLAIENPDLPPFLRFIEDRRYEYCPARRNIYAAYLEGWALYCEALGEEMPGIYATPMSLFGRLSMEMMRAVRLVVDTGIHAEGWSVERAVEYMMEQTGMQRHECEAECNRYEAWPGQACAYKIGEVAIWRMRRKAEERLGDGFDLRRFHTCLLEHGPLPLDTLGALVDAWLESEAAAAGTSR
mmetsp:Transcript_17300/g.28927  ORF Transcript_17300/g.28927 Transcript_17300/m.28927 type:complete len:580 (-) Transcript_17300:177-1916(-)